MRLKPTLLRLRGWVPVPVRGQTVGIIRWVVLDANRLAVTGALLTLTFLSFLALGRVWTFEMQRLFAETDSVQTVLNTLLGGVILLVSVVVSINSIVLTHDMASLTSQLQRVESRTDFRRQIGSFDGVDPRPTDPSSFLADMAVVIENRATALETAAETVGQPPALDLTTFATSIEESMNDLAAVEDRIDGSKFGTLWVGLEANLGAYLDELQVFEAAHRDELSADQEQALDDLIHAFELFETGREYFKTLYYTEEIARFSQTLLVISLPAVLVTAWTILAIDAGTVPRIRLFGLPPLQVFLATAFTVSLAPYVVLTAFVLRTATVARLSASGGPFVLN